MANLTTALNVNVDTKVKAKATEILKELGLNMSTAINVYLVQIVKRRGIPFEIINDEPSGELLEALKEADDIISGKVVSKRYRDIKQLKEALLADDEV